MPDETEGEVQEQQSLADAQEATIGLQREVELYDRYMEQQRRLSCPGCGEGEDVF